MEPLKEAKPSVVRKPLFTRRDMERVWGMLTKVFKGIQANDPQRAKLQAALRVCDKAFLLDQRAAVTGRLVKA